MQSDYVGDELELFAEARNWKRYWASRVAPFLGSRVVDVGAGLGATAKLFAERRFDRYLAVEPDVALAAKMAADADAGLMPAGFAARAGSSQDLAPDECFDTALYIDVLEHIAGDRSELAHIARHLAPGGRIVVLSPAHQALYSEFDRSIGHVRRYDRRSLAALAPAGCVIARLEYLDSAGMLASLANRWLLKAQLPTAAQIRTWDRGLVPLSRLLDPLTARCLGKSILAVFARA